MQKFISTQIPSKITSLITVWGAEIYIYINLLNITPPITVWGAEICFYKYPLHHHITQHCLRCRNLFLYKPLQQNITHHSLKCRNLFLNKSSPTAHHPSLFEVQKFLSIQIPSNNTSPITVWGAEIYFYTNPLQHHITHHCLSCISLFLHKFPPTTHHPSLRCRNLFLYKSPPKTHRPSLFEAQKFISIQIPSNITSPITVWGAEVYFYTNPLQQHITHHWGAQIYFYTNPLQKHIAHHFLKCRNLFLYKSYPTSHHPLLFEVQKYIFRLFP